MENSVIVAAQGMLKIQAECQKNNMRCTSRCAYFSHVVNYLRKVRKQPGGGCVAFDIWVDGKPPRSVWFDGWGDSKDSPFDRPRKKLKQEYAQRRTSSGTS